MDPSDQENAHTLRATCYALMQSVQACWKCHKNTPVIGFLVPAGHETRWMDADPSEDDWERQDCAGIVSNISHLPLGPLERARTLSPCYGLGHTKTGGSYYLNSCVHCQAAQGDFFLFSEPDGAFFPTTPAGISRIQLIPVEAAFACQGDPSYGTISDELGARAW